jgi:hypothetical protein
MDMRFGTSNLRSLHWTGSLKTVARSWGSVSWTLWVYRRSDGRRVALNGRGLYTFLWTGEWGSSVRDRIFSYIRESYQRLGEWSSLVIGCCI